MMFLNQNQFTGFQDVNMNIAKEEGLEKKFKLTTSIGTANMHLFDSDGKIRKYDTPEQSTCVYLICCYRSPSFVRHPFTKIVPFFQYLRSSIS